jgi:hypothetical protein
MMYRGWIEVRILALLLGSMAGGCSISEFLPNWSGEGIAGPAPAYRTIIAPQVNGIVGKSGTERIRISEARRADSLKGASWLVCLEVESSPLLRYYAVFIQRDRIVDSRLSVVIDQCEQQPYAAFDWMAEAKPLPRQGEGAPRRR